MNSEKVGQAWMTWRGLQAGDERLLKELDHACKEADGEEWGLAISSGMLWRLCRCM